MHEPIIILGMPRCRTAWLSVTLSACGVDVSHESMRDNNCNFEQWAEELDARLCAGTAGDADPALVYWIDDILTRFPKAKFITVYRDDSECLGAFAASIPEHEKIIREGWGAYLMMCKTAFDTLRKSGAPVFSLGVHQMGSCDHIADLIEFAAGVRPSMLFVERMQRLKVTSITGKLPAIAAKEIQPLPIPSLAGFDVSGMSARVYTNADFETVRQWWRAHHADKELPQAAIPPLGVVVEMQGEPIAAVWCYESFGVPVAELVSPVTKPGLSLKLASSALAYAICAAMSAAGQSFTPSGEFRFFKAFAPNSMTRFLRRLGFEDMSGDRKAMSLSLS